ncbi:MAG: hypothetical protein AAGA92_01380 [Planctomycetota bacterium]
MSTATLDSPVTEAPAETFVDRRRGEALATAGSERRQFASSHTDLSPEAAELGRAIDQYKMLHRRRFINYEEMLSVIQELGYSK